MVSSWMNNLTWHASALNIVNYGVWSLTWHYISRHHFSKFFIFKLIKHDADIKTAPPNSCYSHKHWYCLTVIIGKYQDHLDEEVHALLWLSSVLYETRTYPSYHPASGRMFPNGWAQSMLKSGLLLIIIIYNIIFIRRKLVPRFVK